MLAALDLLAIGVAIGGAVLGATAQSRTSDTGGRSVKNKHRVEFSARVRELQHTEFGGNFEEALMAAVADAVQGADADTAAPAEKKTETAKTPKPEPAKEIDPESLDANIRAETFGPDEQAEPAKKKRGRPRKVKG